jgi:hypothetical protein
MRGEVVFNTDDGLLLCKAELTRIHTLGVPDANKKSLLRADTREYPLKKFRPVNCEASFALWFANLNINRLGASTKRYVIISGTRIFLCNENLAVL